MAAIKTKVTPRENTHRPWVEKFAELCQTELYRNYCESLRLEREQIIMEGKRTKDPHILSKLDGFDQAASYFQRCLDLVTTNQDINEELDND